MSAEGKYERLNRFLFGKLTVPYQQLTEKGWVNHLGSKTIQKLVYAVHHRNKFIDSYFFNSCSNPTTLIRKNSFELEGIINYLCNICEMEKEKS